MPRKQTWKHCLVALLLSIMSIAVYAQTQTVNGIVKDQSGEPVVGASILEKGTANGCTSDIDGKFSLKVKPGASLLVTYVGYETQEVQARANMNITLSENAELVDEVVVVGYGTQKKKLVTGATINVSGDELMKQNSTNAIGALYSSVPGVNITVSNGQPGADYKITVRGLNTTGGSGPLYVIDGVAGGDISALNPSDIESIDILKDAASAAIYGARASAGVVLVTTRQGEKGKIKINYDGYFAIQKPNFNGVKSVTGMEYINLVDDAFRAAGAKFYGDHYWDLDGLMPVQWKQLQAGTFTGTDWLRESVNPNSYSQNHSLTITGGSDKNHFALGATHSSSDGTLGYPKKTYYDRTTFRMNSDYVLFSYKNLDMVKFGENATFSLISNNSVSQGNIYGNSIHTALVYTPLLPAYNADGSFYTYEDQKRDGWNQADGAYNLLEEYTIGDKENKNIRLQGNVWLEVNPHKDWKFRTV
ncbi:MAG: SusC/RagA family TonB-linked outer membrane protein, partial [Bacteroidales bacterium]|nr:SusC/RagA family TonB-linked outer membrane protein [Bacteroidales bacterium]